VRQILVLEPDLEVRSLYERAIGRLGHRAAFTDDVRAVDLATVDVVVVEPGSTLELGIARALVAERPTLPVVCASIYPANGFGLDPVAFLEKPFRLAALERALGLALAAGEPDAAPPV
jgi:CheY-like chemotaxis protein